DSPGQTQMHRQKILQQLAAYRHRYPLETDTVDRFVAFVEQQPRCFERDNWAGHVTGSAWLLNPARTHLLLTHHRKLNIWIQLGGHSDGDPDTEAVAWREAREESGLPVHLLSSQILDIDIHEIPARKEDPAHFHFDVRYCFVAEHPDFVVSAESNELSWVAIDRLETHTNEISIMRMREKWLAGVAS
ncbi:MAG: NUDIX hydrolase, partial [Pseudomonadota bacterium]